MAPRKKKGYEFQFVVKAQHASGQTAFNRISELRDILWNAAMDTKNFRNGEQQVTQVRQNNIAESGRWEVNLPERNIVSERRVIRRATVREEPPIVAPKKRGKKEKKRLVLKRRK